MSLLNLLGKSPRTKIIATLGDPTPSSRGPWGTYGDCVYDLDRVPMNSVTLVKLIETFIMSGADLIRINLAHAKRPDVEPRFRAVKSALRTAESNLGHLIGDRRLGLLADLPGPKIRFKGSFSLPASRLYVHFDENHPPQTGRWAFAPDELRSQDSQDASALILLGDDPFGEADPQALGVILGATRERLRKRTSTEPVLAFIGDNDATLEVEAVEETTLVCKVIADHTKGRPLSNHKGFTIRGIPKPISAFTDEDRDKLRTLLQVDCEGEEEGRVLSHVGISFCQNREDVRKVLYFVAAILREKFPGHDFGWYLAEAPQLIAKIETEEGSNNIAEILDLADGVMVARGDLALEMKTVDIPRVSKDIVRHANLRGKTVIMATQMLESMRTSIECTRPEAVDVFNAVVDGVDALMLSGETSSGMYPSHAIAKMQELATKAEEFVSMSVPMDTYIEGYFRQLNDIRVRVETWKERWSTIRIVYAVLRGKNAIENDELVFMNNVADIKEERLRSQDSTDRISHAACTMAADSDVAAILSPTQSGRTARMLSRFRPRTWILAAPHSYFTARKLAIDWGVSVAAVIRIESDTTVRKLMEVSQSAIGHLKDRAVIFTCGLPLGKVGTTNLIYRGRVGDTWV